MEILVKRTRFTRTSTISSVYIDGKKQCYILEDMDRGLLENMTTSEIEKIKVYGKTAIPVGRYEVAVSYSDRFKKRLPLLLNVKGFSGIRIHPGNTEADSLGCLLPGLTDGRDSVGQSRIAFNQLFQLIQDANEKVFLTIQRDEAGYHDFVNAPKPAFSTTFPYHQ